MRKNTKNHRLGFTLVELLVTMSIIIVLIGLLIPAINSVRTRVKVGQVATDISSLEAGLADFKAKFGKYPPSRITLHSTSAGWNNDTRSRAIIRRFWPQFSFAEVRDPAGTIIPNSADGANGDFAARWGGAESITLDGPECLVFFLAGVRNADGAYQGFSKNPSQPFSLTGDSRTGPFFKFDQSRISDFDSDNLPEYLDPIPGQTRPYIYLSAYDGQGYNTSDLDKDGDPATPGKWMGSHYTMGTGSSAFNPQSFQIISPGFDGQHGTGGAYDSENADSSLTGRENERDNITNFSGGTLAD